jgi:hypothetical protein
VLEVDLRRREPVSDGLLKEKVRVTELVRLRREKIEREKREILTVTR